MGYRYILLSQYRNKMDYSKKSLELHEQLKGKIEVVSRVSVKTKEALSLAYTPGVAQPCLEIQKDVNKSFELTRRWNLVAVITDGTAILGLGDIGPEAGMPVMEGVLRRRRLPYLHKKQRHGRNRTHHSTYQRQFRRH